ncbi:MAG: energy transducer TonB [Bacteroidota bacterium]
MKKLVFFITMLFSISGFTQEINGDSVPDKSAEFPGGETALYEFLNNTIKYPEYEFQQRIGGKVYVYFIIDESGKTKDIKIAKGIKDAPALEDEAIRVIKAMPYWIPGIHNGKPTAMQFTIPILFNTRRQTELAPATKSSIILPPPNPKLLPK